MMKKADKKICGKKTVKGTKCQRSPGEGNASCHMHRRTLQPTQEVAFQYIANSDSDSDCGGGAARRPTLTKIKEEQTTPKITQEATLYPSNGQGVITWEGKEYALPFNELDLDTNSGEMITIQNRFGGDSVTVPWFAAAVYDAISLYERLQQWEDQRKGLKWFGDHFPSAYMTLLD